MTRSGGMCASRACAIAVSANTHSSGGVRVAVEREDAAGVQRAARQHMVDVLPPRIAVDLDRDGRARGGLEDAIPVRHHARAHAVLAATRMAEDVHARRAHGRQHPPRLIRRRPQRRVRRRDHDLEPAPLVGRHVDGAVGEDVRLDALDQPEASRRAPRSADRSARCCSASRAIETPWAIGNPYE